MVACFYYGNLKRKKKENERKPGFEKIVTEFSELMKGFNLQIQEL